MGPAFRPLQPPEVPSCLSAAPGGHGRPPPDAAAPGRRSDPISPWRDGVQVPTLCANCRAVGAGNGAVLTGSK
jgi:hypothetical protein